ncbi:hypothetical protein LSH36_324g03037 [Paralvinella palmiformis]|uniref:Uncharacterized protein n=1 Tax=Paralvinella palmiformis TaxID=53620 RepID=A0AAD9JHA0_9ANNE|nr:hypothetical protein LSH36_324g03037 [Paralvinella palmiformis]
MSQQSPGHDHDERSDFDSPLDREKRDRKRVSRDRSLEDREYTHAETKRYRTEDVQDKQNGDSRDRSKDRNRSRSSDREGEPRIKDNMAYTENLSTKSSRKSSPDKIEKEKRKSDKQSNIIYLNSSTKQQEIKAPLMMMTRKLDVDDFF